MNNNKDWTGNKSTVFATLGASSHSLGERQVDDYYATEPSAIDDLFNVEEFNQVIYEPACGQGHLSIRMKELGKTVYSSDLVNRGYMEGEEEPSDFLKTTELISCDIITNPPYSLAEEFCRKAIELTDNKVAMFLKLTFLEGQKRKKFFEEFPPKVVYVYSKRKNCAKNGDFHLYKSSAVAYAWYVWEKGYKGETTIKWIN